MKPAHERAIRDHVKLDDRTRELISLANRDLYEGPIDVWTADDDTLKRWPGFSAACCMIADALPAGDLWIDVEIDEVIGDSEPEWHHEECHEDESPCATGDAIHYYPDSVLHVDQREVWRALVGRELAAHL